jgi:hypothetical protein
MYGQGYSRVKRLVGLSARRVNRMHRLDTDGDLTVCAAGRHTDA